MDHVDTITAQFDFDGFTTKMRVKKEITQTKLLGLHISCEKRTEELREELSRFDLKMKLEDFQVLHQQNELIFKHNFAGTGFNLDIDDAALDDEVYPSSLIWSLELSQTKNCTRTSVLSSLTNLLFIFETQTCL